MRRVEGVCVAALGALLLSAPPARAGDVRLHGLLDLVAAERAPAYDLNTLIRGDNPYDAFGVRLFADATVNDRLQVFTQVVLRDATGLYVDGAYLMYTPRPSLDMHVLAGKIPSAIGTWAPHTYSNKNPLISSPLMYQYHSTLVWFEIPPSADALIATAGTGQFAVDYEGYPMGRGMTLVDDSYWDVGITLSGSQRPFEYAASVTAGTPGWGSTAKDENSGKSVLGRVGLAPLPWLRLGVSGAYGPYLIQELNPELPAGKVADDYHQKLAMADLELQGGHLELRGEGATGAWETPTVGDLTFLSGYAELKYAFACGAFLASRYDAMQFGDITDSAGLRHSWDSNVSRYELGAGYRFNRDVVAKLVHQHTRIDAGTVYPDVRRQSLVAAQLSVAF
jgi:hypothetical protein